MSTSGDDAAGPPAKKLKRSYVACRRCHSHKIKCSGEAPCRSCQNSNRADECDFPVRDRKVVVPESYLKKLEAENKALKEEAAALRSAAQPAASSSHSAPQVKPEPTEDPDSGLDIPDTDGGNPIFEDSLRFSRDTAHIRPVYIGDAACAAFGTRLRYYLKGNAMSSHPRSAENFKDRALLRFVNTEFQLPNRTHAKSLVKTMTRFVGNDYHFIMKNSFMARLEETYRSQEVADPVFLCRLFGVFALGELYDKKNVPNKKGKKVPGTDYFLTAVSLLQDLHEEADIDYIETLLILSFYSHALNRKNAAYTFAGLALRLSLTLGLHRNIRFAPNTSRLDIENRRRVWWTCYTFDRMSSAKLGHPIAIRDEDIDCPLPSFEGLTPEQRAEFADPIQQIVNINLTRISGTILSLLYSIPTTKQERNFVKDVHNILTSLKALDSELPSFLRLDHSKNPPYKVRNVASLHLHFNQCIVLTTRPILLHVFKHYVPAVGGTKPPSPKALSPMTSALAEACIQAARASNKLLNQLWVDGQIAHYGYFDAHYIFSSTVVLLMANIIKPSEADKEAIGKAWYLLQSMANDGNLSAIEYLDRLALLQKDLEEAYPPPVQVPPATIYAPPHHGHGQSHGSIPIMTDQASAEAANALSSMAGVSVPPQAEAVPLPSVGWDEYTGQYAPLDEPSIQNWLLQPDTQWSPGTLGIITDPSVPWAYTWEMGETGNYMSEYPEV